MMHPKPTPFDSFQSELRSIHRCQTTNIFLSAKRKHEIKSKQKSKTRLTVANAEIPGDIVSCVRNKGQSVEGRFGLKLVHVETSVKWGTACAMVNPSQPMLVRSSWTKTKKQKQKQNIPSSIAVSFVSLGLASEKNERKIKKKLRIKYITTLT